VSPLLDDGVLFRRGASKREKVFTLVAMAWMGLGVYGVITRFVAAGWWMTAATYLALPLCLFFFVPLLRDRHPANPVPRYARVKRTIYYSGQLALCYGFTWMALTLGAAALVTRLGGDEFTGEYRVDWKSDGGFRSRECDYRLKLVHLESGWSTRSCVSKAFWSIVSPGDSILATLRSSSVGAMVVKVDEEAWTVSKAARSPPRKGSP